MVENEIETSNKGNEMLKNAMNYGLILSLVFIINHLVIQFFNLSQSGFVNSLYYIGIILFPFIGTKNLRDKFQEGNISYGRALGSNILIIALGMFIFSMFVYLFFAYISPESMEQLFVNMEEAYLAMGQADEQVEQLISLTRKITTPASLAIGQFFSFVFMGFIISLISSIFIKKEKNIFED